jgi:hypothetical protein
LNPSTHSRGRLTTFLLASGLFLLNVYFCRELFHIEYLRFMGSIEGAFIGMSRYITTHWNDLTWFPWWNAGAPFPTTYPPLLHLVVAAVAQARGVSTALAYHEVTALAYCLGPVALFALALRLSGSRWAAFAAGLMYSCLSMSAWLVPAIERDLGSFFYPRRLQVLVSWGGGPQVSSMTLLALSLLFLDIAIARRRATWVLLAAVTFGATVVTNWLGAFATALIVASYVFAKVGRGRWKLREFALLGLIAVASYCLVMPLVPPSAIAVLQSNARTTGGDYVHAYQAALPQSLAILAALIAIKFAVRRLAWHLQFAIFFAFLMALITLAYQYWSIPIVPMAERYHLEMEMALVLLIAFVAHACLANRPQWMATVAMAALVLALIQPTRMVRRYARNGLLRAVDITTTIEWKEAQWFNQHWNGERVFVPGSISFWLNAFSDTPQLWGFTQATTDYMVRVADYGIVTGDSAGTHDAEYSVLWMKALGTHAVGVSGPASTENYHDFRNPKKFEGVLEPLWREGDDAIYQVGKHAPLARIVRHADLVNRTPVNAIDLDPLRPYVAALDDPDLPAARCDWINAHDVKITADLQPDYVISMQIAWHEGWHATANGRAIPVLHDAIGLMYVEPAVAGPATVEMIYDGGTEMRVAHWASAITAILLLIACAWQIFARPIPKKP